MAGKLEECSHWNHTIKIALFVYNPDQEIPREEEVERVRESMVGSSEDEEPMRESLLPLGEA